MIDMTFILQTQYHLLLSADTLQQFIINVSNKVLHAVQLEYASLLATNYFSTSQQHAG